MNDNGIVKCSCECRYIQLWWW